jgi:predicted dehydrogenase
MSDSISGEKPGISRRSFVGTGAAAAGLMILPGAALGAARRIGPNDKVNVAMIGAGGMGISNASKLVGENIVAICDVHFENVDRALRENRWIPQADRDALGSAYEKAARFTDYRRMLDRRKDIDAVVVVTPDHHHALAAKMAMERGIHVYVQKPLTYSVREGRLLLDLARKNPKLVTQMGNQGHSGDDGRRVVELIRGGVIGPVREVHVWTNRPNWPSGSPRPAAQATPEGMEWDAWLGPANVDWGFHPDYAHFNWRGWQPFGVGAIGDMGAHLIDFPFWALEPGLPTRIETRFSPWGGDPNPSDGKVPEELANYPRTCMTFYEFGNAKNGPLRMTWYDGGMMPPTPKDLPADFKIDPNGGVMFVGDRGLLFHETYGNRPRLVGEGLEERAAAIPQSLPRIQGSIGGHEQNWIRAIKGQEKISCPFEYAVGLNETMVLGLAAMHAQQPIDYDGAAGRITNVSGPNPYMDRVYRKGWEVF